MLKVSNELMDAFSRAAVDVFEDRMVERLRRLFAEECLELGEEGVREMIQHGIARAQGYGIVRQHDVMLYLNLVMVLGRNFDQDPLLSWGRAILTDGKLPEPSRRMARLYRETVARTQVP